MMIQGSEAWLAARCGRVTASRIADLMARTKTGWGAGRANYMAELVCERLSGQPAAFFVNDAMRWGTEQEPRARAAYAARHGVDVFETGFVPHPEIAMAGASPDGLVGDEGLVEIKCPNSATHLDTLTSGAVPEKYLLQMQFQMACVGRDWCDFASFDPRLPERMQLWVKRVPRDVSLILSIESEVAAFLAELDAKLAKLDALFPVQREAA
jgi:putative phage-type endonuclease